MKKRMATLMAVLLFCISVLSQEALAIELPDPGELADAAAAAIADAAGNAADMASGAAGQVSDIVSGFASQAGEILSDWGKQAGKTADSVKEKLSDAGVTVKISAEKLGDATAQKASELTEKAGKTVDEAIEAVSGAQDYVMDQAGHVIDLAAAAGEHVSSEASETLQVLNRYGSLLMKLAEDAVAGMDLSKPESWEAARAVVDAAVHKAYVEGLIDRETVREETMQIVTRIVFGALMYGYQYQDGQITMRDFVSSLSEVLIREGLPAGVGFLVSLLPVSKIPNAESMAKKVTYYLIAKAYEDKSGDEIQAEEDALIEETIEPEKMTETETSKRS